MIIDFLLDLCARIFESLKKKSKNIYWKNMEMLNAKTVKIYIIEKILKEKIITEKLDANEINELRETIYKNEGLK